MYKETKIKESKGLVKDKAGKQLAKFQLKWIRPLNFVHWAILLPFKDKFMEVTQNCICR